MTLIETYKISSLTTNKQYFQEATGPLSCVACLIWSDKGMQWNRHMHDIHEKLMLILIAFILKVRELGCKNTSGPSGRITYQMQQLYQTWHRTCLQQ
jgi:hypothetical protein